MGAAQSAENADQAHYWNSAPGQQWVTHQKRLDTLLGAVRDELVCRCAPQPCERVLDIGCGAGDTTLALAERTGAQGTVIGADISDPLLTLARRRADGRAGIEFMLADAQTHDFAPGRFDLVASRFGVMFFADPVAAFANLARALRPAGRVVFAAWDAVRENPWMAAAKAAAVARLGPVAADPPGTPGPFAFADSARVLAILTEAGLADAAVATKTLPLEVAGSPEDAAELATTLGPVPRIMAEHNGTEADRLAIAKATAAAFRAYTVPGFVRVPARVHFFSAVRP
jgi:SAM-dependent methyltransferase